MPPLIRLELGRESPSITLGGRRSHRIWHARHAARIGSDHRSPPGWVAGSNAAGADLRRQRRRAIDASVWIRDASLLLQVGDQRHARGVLAVIRRGRADLLMAHANVHAAINATSSRIEVRACVNAESVIAEALIERREWHTGLESLLARVWWGGEQRTC